MCASSEVLARQRVSAGLSEPWLLVPNFSVLATILIKKLFAFFGWFWKYGPHVIIPFHSGGFSHVYILIDN